MGGCNFNLEPTSVPKVKTKHRTIDTKIPVPESLPILETINTYESRSMHGQLPVVWDRAEGFSVHDLWGNKWLDFTSTIFVANAGHGNEQIINTLKTQLDKPLLHTYNFASKIRAEYLQLLIEKTPAQFEKVFLLSAGTEATECAMKLMRLYGSKIGKKKPGIITIKGNWHGRTMGAQMASSNLSQKEWIGFQDPNIYHLPFPYPWNDGIVNNGQCNFNKSIVELMSRHAISAKDDLCGFLLETFQGWGAIFYPSKFIQDLCIFAKENEMLVAFDEMQAGFGRTGKLFGYMHYNIEPDLLCCGKGVSSSLPLAVVLGSKEVMDLPEVGSMSSTHSANPLVCAAGKANLEEILSKDLIENSSSMGLLLHQQLNAIKNLFPQYIRYVFGKGLLAALVFIDEQGEPLSEMCSKTCENAMRKGLLLVHTGRESIKIAPPLVITKDALLEGLAVLEEAIQETILEEKC